MLEDRGGWANAESPDWFADYAPIDVSRTWTIACTMWATINEPWVIVDQGYVEGRHAPGHRDLAEAAAVAKNLLKAHAAAVAAYRLIGEHVDRSSGQSRSRFTPHPTRNADRRGSKSARRLSQPPISRSGAAWARCRTSCRKCSAPPGPNGRPMNCGKSTPDRFRGGQLLPSIGGLRRSGGRLARARITLRQPNCP